MSLSEEDLKYVCYVTVIIYNDDIMYCMGLYTFRTVVLQWGTFFSPSPWDIQQMSKETFLIVAAGQADATGIWWVEARAAAKHPTMRKTAPVTKNYPIQNGKSARIEIP